MKRRFWTLLAGLTGYFIVLNVGSALVAHVTGYAGPTRQLFSLSMTPGYTPAAAHDILTSLGSSGRAADAITLAAFDLAFPLLYATFLAACLRLVARRLDLSPSQQGRLASVPFMAAAANWIADLCILAMVGLYPSTPTMLALGASVFTTLKLTVIGLSLAAALAGGAVAIARTLHRSMPEAPSYVALTAPTSRIERALLAGGIAGTLLFNIGYLVEGMTRSGYDAWTQPVSALSLGEEGWLQIANFITFGLLVGGFALGLRRVMTPGPARIWAPLLQLAVAAGLILIGIFTQDPGQGYPAGVPAPSTPTLHGLIHLVGTFLVFDARVAWCVVMAARFARDQRWRGWSYWSMATAISMIAFLAAFGVAQTAGGPAGLFERLATISASALTFGVAVRLLISGRALAAWPRVRRTKAIAYTSQAVD